jgi:hypothetical protein
MGTKYGVIELTGPMAGKSRHMLLATGWLFTASVPMQVLLLHPLSDAKQPTLEGASHEHPAHGVVVAGFDA